MEGRPLVAIADVRDRHRQDALGVVARADAVEVLRRAHQQRRAGEQRDGEHDLHVGHAGQQPPLDAAGAGARSLEQREAIAPRRAQRRQQPGDDAGDERGEGAEEQDRPADRDGVGARHGVTADGLAARATMPQARPAPSSAAVSASATALDQHEAEQPRPPGADRRARRVFLLALQAAREQQAADVGAGDEEQQADGAEQRHQQPLALARSARRAPAGPSR